MRLSLTETVLLCNAEHLAHSEYSVRVAVLSSWPCLDWRCERGSAPIISLSLFLSLPAAARWGIKALC